MPQGYPNDSSKKWGLARLPAERKREIARMGGIAAHKLGVAHEFSPEEAVIAGRKGGGAGKGKSKK